MNPLLQVLIVDRRNMGSSGVCFESEDGSGLAVEEAEDVFELLRLLGERAAELPF